LRDANFPPPCGSRCSSAEPQTGAGISLSKVDRVDHFGLNAPVNTPDRTTAAAFPRYVVSTALADSATLRWEGLYVRRYRMPRIVDHFLVPATPEPFISYGIAGSAEFQERDSMSRAHKDSYTREQRHKVVDYISQQRWVDSENGKPLLGFHEVPFDEKGNIVKGQRVLPEALPGNPDPVLAAFFDYYRAPRGYHPRGINSNTAWTATTPMSFFNFPMYANIEMISPRPILLIAGEKAHSRYYSEDVYKMASDPKELLIVPDADHVDLYDRMDKIPFVKIAEFFTKNLK
jgi:hypothetical protein